MSEPYGGPTVPARRRRSRRLSSASVVPIVLAILAGSFGYEALQDRSALTAIVVAGTALPAGSPLEAGDTRVVQVHASDALAQRGLVRPAQLTFGWVTAVPLRSGEAVTESELTKPSRAAIGEMSIPVPVQQAVGGGISAGDYVDVIATYGQGGAAYVAQGLRVVAVAPSAPVGGVLGGGTGGYFVVVAVDKTTALRLAAALASGGPSASGAQIQVVRSDGEAASAQVVYLPTTGSGRGP
ncbi:MAG TPA: hypothetical protein VK425_05685 [Acidimicrobiales bacterium]|nr:hypothetical protein [Acidimicrobiales bacterium]